MRSFTRLVQKVTFILFIRKSCTCNIQRFFSDAKVVNFIGKIDIFNIFAQNIHCGYTFEPPRHGGSNEYHARIQKIFSGGIQIPRRGLTENFNMAKINNLAIPGVSGPPAPPSGSAHEYPQCMFWIKN